VKTDDGLHGLQLWVNLPKRAKMTSPRYRGLTAADIPTVKAGEAEVRVLAGEFNGVKGPVSDLQNTIQYYDVTLPPGSGVEIPVPKGETSFVLVADGDVIVAGDELVRKAQAAVLSDGSAVTLSSDKGGRAMLISGSPLKEPVAWRGPIVMNTWEELAEAFDELADGTFIKE